MYNSIHFWKKLVFNKAAAEKPDKKGTSAMKKQMNLSVKILIGLVLGIIVGAIFWAVMGAEAAGDFTGKYIKPFGDIFVNLLKFIVVPLVLLSIMDGVISMGDIGKVGKIGWKTVAYFLVTTAIACSSSRRTRSMRPSTPTSWTPS